jgi:CheY-like chemotaxis protein
MSSEGFDGSLNDDRHEAIQRMGTSNYRIDETASVRHRTQYELSGKGMVPTGQGVPLAPSETRNSIGNQLFVVLSAHKTPVPSDRRRATQAYPKLAVEIRRLNSERANRALHMPRPGNTTGIHMTKVLVADDYRDSADSLSQVLNTLGYETSTAYDGLEAVMSARAFQPDVAILDIEMPVMDGFGAARLLSSTPPPTLIALTAKASADIEAQTAAAGFDFYLPKPVDLDRLLSILQSIAHPPALAEVA